jgi:hypothetical protein
MTILHFAVIAFVVNNAIEEDVQRQQNDVLSNAYRISLIQQIDTVQPQIARHFDPLGRVVLESMDSLQRYLHRGVRDSSSLPYFRFKPDLSLDWGQQDISNDDLYQLSRQETLEKYEVEGFFPRLCIGQGIRVLNNPGNTLGFIIGNFTWMLLLMMPALASILKLLYIRRTYYFVEHLIFSFHYHAFAFLIVSPAYLLVEIWPFWIPIAFGLVLVYLLFAMRRVYGQGWGKTLIKFWLLNQLYLLVLAIFFTFMILVSALLYQA